MRQAKCVYTGLVLITGALACGGALADNCSGNWTNTTQTSETLDLGDGHTLTTFFARGTVSSDNSPMNAVGGCAGYVLTTPDGKSYLAYACARKDANGDSFSDAGGMAPGADYGTWTKTGGTGVFAGGNWKGTWRSINTDGLTTLGTFTGNCN